MPGSNQQNEETGKTRLLLYLELTGWVTFWYIWISFNGGCVYDDVICVVEYYCSSEICVNGKVSPLRPGGIFEYLRNDDPQWALKVTKTLALLTLEAKGNRLSHGWSGGGLQQMHSPWQQQVTSGGCFLASGCEFTQVDCLFPRYLASTQGSKRLLFRALLCFFSNELTSEKKTPQQSHQSTIDSVLPKQQLSKCRIKSKVYRVGQWEHEKAQRKTIQHFYHSLEEINR